MKPETGVAQKSLALAIRAAGSGLDAWTQPTSTSAATPGFRSPGTTLERTPWRCATGRLRWRTGGRTSVETSSLFPNSRTSEASISAFSGFYTAGLHSENGKWGHGQNRGSTGQRQRAESQEEPAAQAQAPIRRTQHLNSEGLQGRDVIRRNKGKAVSKEMGI